MGGGKGRKEKPGGNMRKGSGMVREGNETYRKRGRKSAEKTQGMDLKGRRKDREKNGMEERERRERVEVMRRGKKWQGREDDTF